MADTEQTHTGETLHPRACPPSSPHPTAAQICDAICEIVDECQATEMTPIGARLYIAEGLQRRGFPTIPHELIATAVMSMMLGNMVWDARKRAGDLSEAIQALK